MFSQKNERKFYRTINGTIWCKIEEDLKERLQYMQECGECITLSKEESEKILRRYNRT